ncbi:hypothetical protein CY35_09G033000 [Sphagnum magellanicum]|nr:hypothetical protein CY35_09G033000 [Sphagnum magellanicum]
MGLKEDFDQAAKDALTLPESTTNEDKLILYGLFKVATVGKPETSRPGIFDPKGRAKWDAWKKVEDKSQDEARQEYIVKALSCRFCELGFLDLAMVHTPTLYKQRNYFKKDDGR